MGRVRTDGSDRGAARARRAALAAALAAAAWGGPARAQTPVPVVDPSAIAQITAGVAKAAEEVAQVTQIVTTVGKVLNVQHDISGALGALGINLNNIGGGSIGDLISAAQMGFTAVKDLKNATESVVAEARSMLNDPLATLSVLTGFSAIMNDPMSLIRSSNPNIAGELAALNGVMQGTGSVSQQVTAITRSLFTPSLNPTGAQVENVNAARRALIQSAAINGMTQAAAAMQSVGAHGQDSLGALMSGVSGASDVRGDIKANSAVMLKVLEQAAAGNALLARLVQMEAATQMGAQGSSAPDATMGGLPAGTAGGAPGGAAGPPAGGG